MTIAAYMAHLTSDKSARDEFHRDPEGAMTRFGLSAEDRAIVATRDPAKIRAAVAKVEPKRSQLPITF
jgi:Aromatic-ring-opening dioxygenase LigAB, LigA subunit